MSSIFGYNSRTFSSRACACPSPTAPSIRISSATAVSKASSSSASPCPGLPAVAGAIAVCGSASQPQSLNLEGLDFLKTRALRQSIHLRERGHCFYCLRRTDARVQCLDHVVPRVRAGRNSYRNLVSSCLECNSLKGERPAAHFLRWLYRERRITSAELNARLRALDALASGKLPPPVLHPDTPIGKLAHHPKSVIPSAARYSAPSSGVRSMKPSCFSPLPTRHSPARCGGPLTIAPRGRPPGSRSGL